MIELEAAVHSDPEIMGGKPVFVGTRVPVKNLFDYLAGSGLAEFLHQFPSVKREQALAVIRQAGETLVNDACAAR
jgi:uncharacterized protein (DUF433 family)